MSNNKQKLPLWQQACAIVGTDHFAPLSMEQRADIIFHASCKVLGLSPDYLPDCFAINADFHASLVSSYKLQVICKALNGNWKQDWNNWDQQKWSPWFYMNNPGFRFDDSDFVPAGTYTTGGARLCLKNRVCSDFVGRYCITLYRDLLGGPELAADAKIAA